MGNSLVEPQEEKGKSHQKHVSNKNPLMNIFISIIQDNRTVETIRISSADEQRNKLWSLHMVEHHSAIKRSETPVHATI